LVTSADGTEVAWHEAGEGPPAVLVHGASGDRGSWIACTPLLSPRLRVFALDRRGRGHSRDAPEYAIEREYEDVSAVIEEVGEPVILVGHSYGGIVSLGAARLTDLVERLVLYEPPILVPDVHDCEAWALEIEGHLAAGERSEAAAAFIQRVATGDELDVLRGLEPAWRQLCRDAGTIPRELRSLERTRHDDHSALTAPTLLLRGERSTPELRDGIDHLGRMLPDTRTVELPGQGHLAQVFAPQDFCRAVLDFAG
jgi:pimeloyl-ACP methyl ester carboxylesterase